MKIKLFQHTFDIRSVKTKILNEGGEECKGICENPYEVEKGKIPKIRIINSLQDKEELEVVIHEMLHGLAWHVDEEYIDQAGKDLSEALWKLGWRKLEEN